MKEKYKVTYLTKKFRKPKEKIYQKLHYAYTFYKRCKSNNMEPKLRDLRYKSAPVLFS